MKIVGIATRARITDYSLPYTFVQTVWWTLWLSHLLLHTLFFFFFYVMYVFRIYVYTYRHSANKKSSLLRVVSLFHFSIVISIRANSHLESLNVHAINTWLEEILGLSKK